jgi:hypothetical protein
VASRAGPGWRIGPCPRSPAPAFLRRRPGRGHLMIPGLAPAAVQCGAKWSGNAGPGRASLPGCLARHRPCTGSAATAGSDPAGPCNPSRHGETRTYVRTGRTGAGRTFPRSGSEEDKPLPLSSQARSRKPGPSSGYPAHHGRNGSGRARVGPAVVGSGGDVLVGGCAVGCDHSGGDGGGLEAFNDQPDAER